MHAGDKRKLTLRGVKGRREKKVYYIQDRRRRRFQRQEVCCCLRFLAGYEDRVFRREVSRC